MKVIELDLNGCADLDDLHERIRKAFGFPTWYGKNWDAFWDLLWSECEADKVIIKGEQTMPSAFSEHLKIMHKTLEDHVSFCEQHGYPPFSYEVID